MDLPFDSNRFDVSTMALVIFFVPEPEKGLEEMKRVVRSGGLVSAYAWDIFDGGFPLGANPFGTSDEGNRISPTAKRRGIADEKSRVSLECGRS